MTKREHQQAVRLQPLGAEGMAKIRQIVERKQFAKVNETTVDLFSASAIVAVFDALNDANKEKLLALPVYKVAEVCLKLIK